MYLFPEKISTPTENTYIGIVKDYKQEEEKTTLYLKGEYNIVAILNENIPIQYGDKVSLEGEYKEMNNPTIPYTFSYKNYLESKNIVGVFEINKIEMQENVGILNKIKNKIRKKIDQIDQKGYLLAFLLGDKSKIDKETYEKFSKIGVTHLFALSGMHVGILSNILFFFLKKFPKGKYWITFFLLLLYGIMVGFPSSLKQCIFFFFISYLNKTYSLGLSPIKILSYIFIGIIVLNYKSVLDIGFLFSFSIVFGILLFSKDIKSRNKLYSSFKLSCIAFLFSLPISLAFFYNINILSILYNLFYIPFVSLLLYPFALITFFLPFLYPIFSFLINFLENLTIFLSQWNFLTIYLSLSYTSILLYYLFILLYYYVRKRRFLLFAGLILLIKILIPYLDSNGYIYFFDVGQGDSCLILSPYRKDVILIDTGGITSFKKKPYYVSDSVIEFLKHEGIKSIDYFILSHGDADHGLDTLHIAKEIKIKKIKINLGENNELEKEILKKLEVGEYNPKNLKIHFLNNSIYTNENENSLFTLIQIYNTSFLSSGDAYKKQEEEIISKFNLDIDIVKIGHHGSKTSSSISYLKSINPKYAIISSGRNNRFNHPNLETINTLESLSIPYYNTQTDGTILFKINKKGITKFTFPP